MTAVSKPVLEDLTGWGYRLTFSALLLTLLALFGAVLLVLWAIRIKAAWFTPRPEVILRQDIVSAEKRYIYRHLILHYAEATIANSWVSEDKARRLSRAQVCLLAAFVLAVLMGLSRAIFSVPDKPSSPAALPSATSTD